MCACEPSRAQNEEINKEKEQQVCKKGTMRYEIPIVKLQFYLHARVRKRSLYSEYFTVSKMGKFPLP